MKQLESDIRNKRYKKVYILTGTQSYNRKRYLDALIKVFLPDGDTMNLTKFSGKKTDLKEVADTVNTMPFFAEKRVVVLEDTGLFSAPCDELADMIASVPDTCVVIFSEESVDLRLRQTKAVKENGCIARFDNLSEDELRDFIMGRLAKEHRPITKDALDMFIARCSDDMWAITNELEKVISYTFKKDGIRTEDIEAVIPAPPEDRIFAMIDAILDGNTEKAVGHYNDLLALRTDPVRIMALIRDQLRLMLHVSEMNREHLTTKQMASELGNMKEARVRMALSAARKSSKISLIDRITRCAETDSDIKNGLIDKQIGTETLIIDLCR